MSKFGWRSKQKLATTWWAVVFGENAIEYLILAVEQKYEYAEAHLSVSIGFMLLISGLSMP